MHDTRIIAFDRNDRFHIDSATALFKAYYHYFHSLGIQLPLVPHGEKLWMDAALQSVNRLSVLPLAIAGDQVIGFAQGTVKLLPAYLGGHKVGVVQHVYVEEAHQGQGIATALVQELQKWFAEKQVHSVELQVTAHNGKADGFWKKMGFEPELSQWRKIL
jgi:ribosomal protein S18 acetylase RimI-like enzyme